MKKNILIIPASSEAGLEIYECLRYYPDYVVYGGDTKIGYAESIYDTELYKFSPFDSEQFVVELKSVVSEKILI